MNPPSDGPESRRTDRLAQLVLIGIILVLFSDVVFLGAVFVSRDMLPLKIPMESVVRDAILSGHIPYWDPTFSGGQPLAANPENELFYPPNWLILLPGFPYGLSLLIVLHLALGWIGVFRLSRVLGLGTGSAVVGALAFGLSGLFVSMTNLPPEFFATAWIPLILALSIAAFRSRRVTDAALAALALGMQFLIAEPSISLQTVLLMAATGGYFAWTSAEQRGRAFLKAIGIFGAVVGAALCVAAVQLVPAADLLRDTVRGRGFARSISGTWSFPPMRIVELAVDRWFGPLSGSHIGWYWGRIFYGPKSYPYFSNVHLGILVVSLALASIRTRTRWRGAAWTLIGGFFVLAVGTHTPLFAIFASTPIGRITRYPEKFIISVALVLVVMAAAMFERILGGDDRARKTAASVAATIAVIAGGLWLASWTSAYSLSFGRLWELSGPVLERAVVLSRGILAISAGCAALTTLLWLVASRARPMMTTVLACVVILVELGFAAGRDSPRMPRTFLSEPAALQTAKKGERIFGLAAMATNSEVSRNYEAHATTGREVLYLHRDILVGRLPNLWGRSVVMDTDVSATSLVATTDFVGTFLPVYKRRGREAFAMFMEMSGASDITLYRPFDTEWSRSEGRFDRMRPIEIVRAPHPQAYFATAIDRIHGPDEFVNDLTSRPWKPGTVFVGFPPFAPDPGKILSSERSANRIDLDVDADGRAFLVVCETPHRYWRATVDGKPAALRVANVGYQGLVVNRGRHHVRLRYRNPLVDWSGAVTLISLTLIALLLYRGRSRSRNAFR